MLAGSLFRKKHQSIDEAVRLLSMALITGGAGERLASSVYGTVKIKYPHIEIHPKAFTVVRTDSQPASLLYSITYLNEDGQRDVLDMDIALAADGTALEAIRSAMLQRVDRRYLPVKPVDVREHQIDLPRDFAHQNLDDGSTYPLEVKLQKRQLRVDKATSLSIGGGTPRNRKTVLRSK